MQLKDADKKCSFWEREAKEAKNRIEELTKEKESHIVNTKKQI